MRTHKYIGFILFLIVLISCSQPKLLLSYGHKDKLLIYNDSTIIDSKIEYSIKGYSFHIRGEDFEDAIKANYEIDFTPFLYLKKFISDYIQDETKVHITEEGNTLFVNNKEIKYPLSQDIRFALDQTIKKGSFRLERLGQPIMYIEYVYWEPQYQGSIYSNWIVKDKVINEIIFGFVD